MPLPSTLTLSLAVVQTLTVRHPSLHCRSPHAARYMCVRAVDIGFPTTRTAWVRVRVRVRGDVFPQSDPQCIDTQ